MNITKKLEKAINQQITAEFWSSRLYTAMSFYCEKNGLDGFAHWLRKQAEEENEHAYKMASFLMKRGGTVTMGKAEDTPNTWKDLADVFKAVYAHECKVSKMIDELVTLAAAEKDKATELFFWDFVREQIEEEETAAAIADRIAKFGKTHLFELNQQMMSR